MRFGVQASGQSELRVLRGSRKVSVV
jgi:hypothetical protein